MKNDNPGTRILCVKYVIFGCNLTLTLFGVILLVLAVWMRLDPRFSQFLSEQYFEVTNGQNLNVRTLYISAYILLVVGCFLIVTAGSGCCGSIRESCCCLSTYCILLIITALIELGVGIFIFVEREHIEDELGTALDYMVQRYYIGPDILTMAMDALQDGFDCCGNSGCGDYRELHIPLPRSCDLSCDSCRIIIYRVLRDSFTVLAIIGFVALAAQVVAVAMAFWLCCKIRETDESQFLAEDLHATEDCSPADVAGVKSGGASYPQFTVLSPVPPASSLAATPVYRYQTTLAHVQPTADSRAQQFSYPVQYYQLQSQPPPIYSSQSIHRGYVVQQPVTNQ